MSAWSIATQLFQIGGLFATVILGVIGIKGNAEENNRKLSARDKRAITLVLIAGLFTFGTQVTGAVNRHYAEQTAARETAQHQRGRWYGTLSTRGAYVDMEVSIGIKTLAKLDPEYAARLEQSLRRPIHCKSVGGGAWLNANGEHGSSSNYICGPGIQFERDTHPNQRVLWFMQHSMLFPTQSPKELAAYVLLGTLGARLRLSGATGGHEGNIESFNVVGLTPRRTFFIFNGSRVSGVATHLKTTLANLPVASVIDFLGHTITLSTEECRYGYGAGNFAQKLKEACKRVRLLHFALILPHGRRRDIVFDQARLGKKNAVMAFTKTRRGSKGHRPVFTYTFPKQPWNLPVSAARDVFGDRRASVWNRWRLFHPHPWSNPNPPPTGPFSAAP